jgi:hypothetical protein
MRAIQIFTITLALFFSFFISFALFNFESVNWGLQASWFFWLFFIFVYTPNFILSKISVFSFLMLSNTGRVIYIIFTILLITVLSWVLQNLGAIQYENMDGDNSGMSRSIIHSIYLLFYFVVFMYCRHFFACNKKLIRHFYKYLCIYPFVFISLWGGYQVLSTYGFVKYIDILNNNLSTGFTYLRFVDSNRSSSVFPEPSEYSYYLFFMLPIIFSLRRLDYENVGRLWYFSLIILLLSQLFFSRSIALIFGLPISIYVLLRVVFNRPVSRAIFYFIFLVPFVAIFFLGALGERVITVFSGDDGSALDRLQGFFQAIELFISSPIFGLGFGFTRGMDLFSFLLASVGFLGVLILFFHFYKLLSGPVITYHANVLRWSIILLFATSSLSNNILDHIFIWVILAYYCAVSDVNIKRRLHTRNSPAHMSGERLEKLKF